jgi:microcystin-dependent protein
MSNPFLGEIRIFGFNFAPRGWALCNGQILSIAQNTALFSLLGTQYGGNGQTTFALPNLQSRVPVHQGTGPGLSNYVIGEVTGTENVTLLTTQMPAHNHTVSIQAFGSDATSAKPAGKYLANSGAANIYNSTQDGTLMGAQPPTGIAGGNQPFPILQPLLVLNFCIAMQGIFPSRN